MPNNKASIIEWPYAGFGMERSRAIRLHRERSSSTPHEPIVAAQKVAIYARVSSREHRANLELQAERLSQYCEVKGYQVGTSCEREPS
jgi:predicted site-specific integrase-resolvase